MWGNLAGMDGSGSRQLTRPVAITGATGADGAVVPSGELLGGLTAGQARRLLAEVGPNTVPEQRPSVLARLVGALWAPVPWMLEATIVLELALGKWMDAAIVAAVLALNAALGFLQQGRAAAALALLRSRLAVNARALRDGSWQLMPAAELVPGDVVHIRVGDFVPADLAVAEGDVLVDQSALTGESIPVESGPGAKVYSGSSVARGEATGTVTTTGARTYFGRTAELVRTSRPSDHLAGVADGARIHCCGRGTGRGGHRLPGPGRGVHRRCCVVCGGAAAGVGARRAARGVRPGRGAERANPGTDRHPDRPTVRGAGGRRYGRVMRGQDRHPDPQPTRRGLGGGTPARHRGDRAGLGRRRVRLSHPGPHRSGHPARRGPARRG